MGWRTTSLPRGLRPQRKDARLGFTLIELVVVIILLAMLSTAAAISLKPHVDSQRLRRATEQWIRADQWTRTRCRQIGAFGAVEFDAQRCEVVARVASEVRRIECSAEASFQVRDLSDPGNRIPASVLLVNPRGVSSDYRLATTIGELRAVTRVAGIDGVPSSASENFEAVHSIRSR